MPSDAARPSTVSSVAELFRWRPPASLRAARPGATRCGWPHHTPPELASRGCAAWARARGRPRPPRSDPRARARGAAQRATAQARRDQPRQLGIAVRHVTAWAWSCKVSTIRRGPRPSTCTAATTPRTNGEGATAPTGSHAALAAASPPCVDAAPLRHRLDHTEGALDVIGGSSLAHGEREEQVYPECGATSSSCARAMARRTSNSAPGIRRLDLTHTLGEKGSVRWQAVRTLAHVVARGWSARRVAPARRAAVLRSWRRS